jgi:hypothetical protein
MTLPTIVPSSTATIRAPGDCASRPTSPSVSSVLDGSAVNRPGANGGDVAAVAGRA